MEIGRGAPPAGGKLAHATFVDTHAAVYPVDLAAVLIGKREIAAGADIEVASDRPAGKNRVIAASPRCDLDLVDAIECKMTLAETANAERWLRSLSRCTSGLLAG